MKHELWVEEDEGSQTFCLAGVHGDGARKILGEDATLVWVCEADSHFDAMTKYYKYMKWGEYKSDYPDQDKESYKRRGWE
ncbi:MAG: hypothetical protein ACW7DS_18165 [Paraglaciecola chathamensis]